MKAEDPGRERLDPERERRLVDRHQPARVERAVEEVVPARAHRADGGAVVVVGPAVAVERPEVQHSREQQQRTELGEGQRPAARDRAGARLVEGLRAAARAGRARARRARWRERAARAAGAGSLGIVGMMGNSVGAPAWSDASRPWESPESPILRRFFGAWPFVSRLQRDDSRSRHGGRHDHQRNSAARRRPGRQDRAQQGTEQAPSPAPSRAPSRRSSCGAPRAPPGRAPSSDAGARRADHRAAGRRVRLAALGIAWARPRR